MEEPMDVWNASVRLKGHQWQSVGPPSLRLECLECPNDPNKRVRLEWVVDVIANARALKGGGVIVGKR